MIQAFEWAPAVDAAGDATFLVRSAVFGDGYQQDVADGLNNRSESWPLTFIGNEAKTRGIMDFLDWHGGWRSFQWTPPLGKPGLYKCKAYNRTAHGAGAYTVTATFTQSFGVSG